MTRGAPDNHPWQAPVVTQQTEGANLYSVSITTLSGVVAASPTETDIVLEKGFLNRLRVRVPAGHAGLTGVCLFNDSGQIIPKSDPSWFIGDDEVFDYTFDVDVPLWSAAYKLQAKTYNLDDSFSHTHYLQLYVVGYPS